MTDTEASLPRLPAALQPMRLSVFEIGSVVGRGVTQARYATARDEAGGSHRIILKLRRPPTPNGNFGATSLAAELLFAVLARGLGLNVPDYAIADLSVIIANTPRDPGVRELLLTNVGLNFASVQITPQPAPWDPACRLQSFDLRQALEDVLAFDFAIINGDRKTSNPNLLWNGSETVHVIDHGLACPVHAWPVSVRESSPLMPDDEVRSHCGHDFLLRTGRLYDQLIARWTNLVSAEFLEAMRAEIPAQWESSSGDLDAMISFLRLRHARFQEMKTALRRLLT